MYEIYVNNALVNATDVEFDDTKIEASDVPGFRFTMPNPGGIALAQVKEGDEVEIYRAQELRFTGIIEGYSVRRRASTVEFTGRNKHYLTLLKRVCEYYRAYNGRYAPVINPWSYGREENGGVVNDGLRPDEMLRAVIGTKFFYQDFFTSADALYKKENVVINEGVITHSGPANSLAIVESVPLHNGPDIVNPMGKIHDAKITVQGKRGLSDPILKLSRDGGNTWYRCADTVWNGTGWTASTKFNTGLTFDGVNTNAELTYGPAIALQSGHSVSFWIRLDSDPNVDANNNWRVLLKHVSGSAPFYLYLEESRTINFTVVKGGTHFRYIDTSFSGETLTVGEWTHITYTYDSTTGAAVAYKNGTVSRSGTMKHFDGTTYTAITAGDLDAGTSNWRVSHPAGTDKPNGSGALPATLRDFRFYDRPITETEVNTIKAREGGVFGGLVGYWKFNDGGGTTLKDWSGQGLDATLKGADATLDYTTDQASNQPIGNGDVVAAAQQIKLDVAAEMTPGTNVAMRLHKVGAPTGLVTIRLTDSRGSGGNAITFNAESLSATAGTLETFDLGSMLLRAGRRYYLSVEYSGGDASNYIAWRYGGDTYTGTDRYRLVHFASGSWSGVTTEDYVFKVALTSLPWADDAITGFETGEPTTGHAVLFTGSTVSTIDHMSGLSGNKDAGFTLAANVKIAANAASGTLFEKENAWKLTYDSDKHLSLYVYRSSAYSRVATTYEPIDNEWRSVFATWRPSEPGRIYIDNVSKTATNTDILIHEHNWASEGQLKFGQWAGQLDDMLFFDRGLEEDEQTTIFQNTGVIGRGMVLELLFEEGAGLTAKDTSYNGNNATLGSDTTWVISRSRESKSEPVRNHLAYRLETYGRSSNAHYVKLEATTESDTGITEGTIEKYVNAYTYGTDNIVANFAGMNRLQAIEQIRKSTVSSDVSKSPNWDVWIDGSGKLHFKEVRGDKNLLENARFDTGSTSPWRTEKAGVTVAYNRLDGLTTNTGAYSWRVQVDTGAATAGDNYAGIYQEATLPTNNGEYRLSVNARRTTGTGKVRLIVVWKDANGNTISSPEQTFTPQDLFLPYEITVERPANAVTGRAVVRAQFPNAGDKGTLYFDDVRFEPKADVPTYSFDNLNLDVLDRNSNADVFNKIIAKGAGSEPYAMTIAGDTLKDGESIKKYGERVGYFVDQNITDLTTLYNRARAYLKLMAWPRQELRVTTMNDWSCPWRVGDTIRIEDDESLSTGTLRVMSATYKWLGGTERIDLDLTNAAPTIGGMLRQNAQENRTVKNIPAGSNNHGTGAGIGLRMGQDQDGNIQAAEHEIVITEPESVNRIYLSLKTEAFDSYSIGAEAKILKDEETVAGGGGQTIPSSYNLYPAANSAWKEITIDTLDATKTMFVMLNTHAVALYANQESGLDIEFGDGTTWYKNREWVWRNYNKGNDYSTTTPRTWFFVWPGDASGKTLKLRYRDSYYEVNGTTYSYDGTKPTYTLMVTLHKVWAPTHNHGDQGHTHDPIHGIYKFRDVNGVIYPTSLGLYVGDTNYLQNATFDNTATFGDEDASVEYRRVDISGALNPDGSYVFRDGEGKFKPGIYKVYVKPTANTARNPKRIGKVVINSYIERQRIGQ